MTNKARKFTYDTEQRQRGLFAKLIREVGKGNRTPLLTYLRSVALSREQQSILADWLSHVELGGNKPKRLTIEDYIIALARVAQKGEHVKLPPGKRLKKGRRQEILEEVVEALAVDGELHGYIVDIGELRGFAAAGDDDAHGLRIDWKRRELDRRS
jgi:hypothetical protein